MSDLGWIVIRNWDRYQARRDERDWHYVRNQVGLLSDDDYLELPDATALMWHRLLVAYASSRGQLRATTRSLNHRLSMWVTVRQLELLEQAGFIRFSAAKPPRLGSQPAAPRARDALAKELPTTQDQERPKEQTQDPKGPEVQVVQNPPNPSKGRSPAREAATNPRALGTNPRATGTNPRAQGTNPRASNQPEPNSQTGEGEDQINIDLTRYWAERNRELATNPDLERLNYELPPQPEEHP